MYVVVRERNGKALHHVTESVIFPALDELVTSFHFFPELSPSTRMVIVSIASVSVSSLRFVYTSSVVMNIRMSKEESGSRPLKIIKIRATIKKTAERVHDTLLRGYLTFIITMLLNGLCKI